MYLGHGWAFVAVHENIFCVHAQTWRGSFAAFGAGYFWWRARLVDVGEPRVGGAVAHSQPNIAGSTPRALLQSDARDDVVHATSSPARR